jgi:hypothetical protein
VIWSRATGPGLAESPAHFPRLRARFARNSEPTGSPCPDLVGRRRRRRRHGWRRRHRWLRRRRRRHRWLRRRRWRRRWRRWRRRRWRRWRHAWRTDGDDAGPHLDARAAGDAEEAVDPRAVELHPQGSRAAGRNVLRSPPGDDEGARHERAVRDEEDHRAGLDLNRCGTAFSGRHRHPNLRLAVRLPPRRGEPGQE